MAKRRERRRQAYGPILLRLRTEAGLTQRELAKLADVPSGWIGAVEAGWIAWPSSARIDRLEAAFASLVREAS